MPRLALFFALAIGSLIHTVHAGDTPSTLLGDRVPSQVLRIMPSDTPPNQRLAGIPFIAGYEVIGQPVPIPADSAATLTATLKSPDAFTIEKNEEHMRPGVAYRFGAAPDSVDVLVCFSCDKVAFITPGSDAISATYQITQPTRDVLLGVAKELLPKDEAIQALPKVRSKNAIPPPAAPVPKDAPRAGQSTGA